MFKRSIKILIVLSALAGFWGLCASVQAAVIIKPPSNLGLIGYWPFDEGSGTKAGDFSGKGNLMTLYNGPTWTDGKRGGALYFNGADTNVGISGSSSLKPTGSITISAFIKISSAANNKTITIRGDTYAVIPWAWFSYLGASNKIGLWNNNGNSWASSTAISIEDGKWHHLAVSATTGSAPNFYLDGVNVNATGENTYSETIHNIDSYPFEIGSRTHTTAGIMEELTGSIDEVRVYNRALSASEVKSLYNAGVAKFNAPQTSRLTRGLVGYWTMDGKDVTDKVYDRSGQNNNGYFYNGATSSAKVAGKVGQAMRFDGVDDCVVSSSMTNTSKAEETLSFWVKPSSVTGTRHFISQGSGSGDLGNYSVITQSGASVVVKVWNGVYNSTTASSVLTANKWTHISFVHSVANSINKIYIDGAEVANGSVYQDTSSNHSYIAISGDSCGSSFAYGSMDEVRLYNRALSASEVKSLYNAGVAKFNAPQTSRLTRGLVGYWTMDGKDVTDKVYDRSGQNNNGYFYNGATSSAKVIGKVGQGLSISRYNWVDIASSISTGNSNWTTSVWAKTTSALTLYILTNQSGGPVTNAMKISAGKINYDHYNGAWSSESGTISVNDGRWHLLTWVNSSNQTMNMYVDGALDAGNVSSAVNNTGPINRIGNIYGASPTSGMTGSLDEVRIYNRALSASEVKQLYLMGK